MDKETLKKRIEELEALKKKIDEKRKEVDKQLLELRPQYYKYVEEENKRRKEEEAKKPSPDTSFLASKDWGGFD